MMATARKTGYDVFFMFGRDIAHCALSKLKAASGKVWYFVNYGGADYEVVRKRDAASGKLVIEIDGIGKPCVIDYYGNDAPACLFGDMKVAG